MRRGNEGQQRGATAIAAFRVSPSAPTECLSQIVRPKKRIWDDMLNEMLQASAASHREHRAWRKNIVDCLEKERVQRSKAQESQQEKEREVNQDIIGLVRQQTQILRTLVDLQVQQSWARLPLQPIEHSILEPPYPTLNIPCGIRSHCTTPSTPPRGDIKESHSFTYTDL
ncbi:unnamed protein product [Caretta caretta]